MLYVVLQKPRHSESASSDRCKVLNATTRRDQAKDNSVYFLNYFKSVHNKRYLLFHINNCICLEMLKCLCSEMFKLYKGFFEMNTAVMLNELEFFIFKHPFKLKMHFYEHEWMMCIWCSLAFRLKNWISKDTKTLLMRNTAILFRRINFVYICWEGWWVVLIHICVCDHL